MTLDVTLDQTNLILTGLGELPAKHVFALIETIRNQSQAQLTSLEDAPATPVIQTLDDHGPTN